jgi:hypothetical protein
MCAHWKKARRDKIVSREVREDISSLHSMMQCGMGVTGFPTHTWVQRGSRGFIDGGSQRVKRSKWNPVNRSGLTDSVKQLGEMPVHTFRAHFNTKFCGIDLKLIETGAGDRDRTGDIQLGKFTIHTWYPAVTAIYAGFRALLPPYLRSNCCHNCCQTFWRDA